MKYFVRIVQDEKTPGCFQPYFKGRLPHGNEGVTQLPLEHVEVVITELLQKPDSFIPLRLERFILEHLADTVGCRVFCSPPHGLTVKIAKRRNGKWKKIISELVFLLQCELSELDCVAFEVPSLNDLIANN